jgi:Protein of unknown function (DUF3489)
MNRQPPNSGGKEIPKMKTFTIDAEDNISVFTTPEEAAAAATTPFDTFASQKELLSLVRPWPTDRLVAMWNSLPGVTPVKSFKSAAVAAGKIWGRIQRLGETTKPNAEPTAKGGARAAKSAAAKEKGNKKTTPAKKAPKAAKSAKSGATAKPAATRDGSKKAIVLEMMRRKGGCTLAEIMKATDWQAHTVRGFVSGTLGKKMGLTVTSAKNDAGERTYSLLR